MVASPLKTFGGIARFLGLDPPRAGLERALKFSAFRVLKEQEERRGFVERMAARRRRSFGPARRGRGGRC